MSLLREVAALFLRLGAVAFGGPLAHVGKMEREVVQRRQWVDSERLTEGVAVCQALPGPLSTQLAVWLGYVRAGWMGAWTAGVCFILPACLMVTGLSALYFGFGTRPPSVTALFYGVNAAVVAVMASAAWRMAKAAVRDRLGAALFAVSFALLLFTRAPLVLVLLCAGIVSLLWSGLIRRPPAGAAAALIPLWLSGDPGRLLQLAWLFLRTGAFLYGGGFVIIAFIEQDLVGSRGWLTRAEFLDGVALGQMTPGPILTTATFVGYRVGGLAGAAVATAAIFLPSFLYILLAAPNLAKWRSNARFQAFLRGANPAVVGALFAACVTLGYGDPRLSLAPTGAVRDWPTLLIFAASHAALTRFNIGAQWVVLCGAAAGLLAHLV